MHVIATEIIIIITGVVTVIIATVNFFVYSLLCRLLLDSMMHILRLSFRLLQAAGTPASMSHHKNNVVTA